jgi:hypothetical protein
LLGCEARTMATISTYKHEHGMIATSNSANSPSSTPIHESVISTLSPAPTPINVAVKELSEHVAALTSMIKSSHLFVDITAATPTPAPAPVPTPAPVFVPAPAPTRIPRIPTFSSHRVPRVSRCISCDSPDHSRRSECPLLAEAPKSGNIRINEVGRVVLFSALRSPLLLAVVG